MSNYNELRLTYQGGRQETITLTANTIDYGAYQYRDIVAVEVPEIVETIGSYAFCDNNELANIVLNEGLQRIEGQAFQHGVYTAVTIPSTVTYIGMNAFNTWEEQSQDQHTFTLICLATTPPTLDDGEGITFGDPSKITAIYVPSGSVSSYKSAWSQYASKISGGGEPETGFTNLTMSAAYVGLEPVQKIYLGLNLVWEPAPDPCEGLTGQSLCECEGRYWWDGECHDEPEPIDSMFWEPLTIKIENPGTAATTGLLWRLSGVSRTSDVSQYGRNIVYSKNDGPLTEVQMTGTPTTSKTVDVVIATGLSQGDVFRFYGASSNVGGYGFVSGSTEAPYHYFVNYQGLEAKVYGNIKSLLTTPNTWEGMVHNQDKEAIDDIPMNDRAFMRLFQGKTGFTFNEDRESMEYNERHLILPDCNLSIRCFADMFNGCTRMTVAPELPATALTEMCYYHLFSGCTGLVTPPELPATTLAAGCYRSMFQYCSSLRDAPVLPAPVVAASAYSWMFGYCRNLTGVTCLATDISANNSTSSWLSGVNRSGTFTKAPSMTGWTRDTSGIPTGWTVIDADV